ncbi:16S rRNA (guanine(527)-N(7))-methyltransferase RsmG [Solicola sp. PLA-1-18]|uniref:16S rRNA (guanine(527)-N(7))-methyltransferase RsmG n=1 Tax=Solicola sp. PLA-1-18 TaxID=3380532 RepID=UPI003B7C53F4
MFGSALPLAERYADLLAGAGVERGLIGPRETGRLWDRHLLNSAVMAEVLPHGGTVADVGSGAGLPGIPIALARPDLHLVLVEPLKRRATFLDEVVDELDLADRVQVVRLRAEDAVGTVSADVVVSRALAPLARLVRWCLPLTTPSGHVAALKGESAPAEIDRDLAEVEAAGGGAPDVVRCGVGVVDPAATVVRVPRHGSSLDAPTSP